MIDTHVHLDDSRYNGELDNVVEQYLQHGVQFVINNSCDIDTLNSGIALANKYPSVFCTLGIHPHTADTLTDEIIDKMRTLSAHPKVVAIGEIGLDYYYDNCDRQVQRDAFVRQLQLAHQLSLPVTLHIRDAYGDAVEILKDNSKYLNNGVLWHCYSGSAELARQMAKLGHYFAFGGAITFKNANKDEVIKNVPITQVLCETDCPYMTPVPLRGKTNYPHYVSYVVDKLAQVYGVTTQQMNEQILSNCYTLFNKISQHNK